MDEFGPLDLESESVAESVAMDEEEVADLLAEGDPNPDDGFKVVTYKAKPKPKVQPKTQPNPQPLPQPKPQSLAKPLSPL